MKTLTFETSASDKVKQTSGLFNSDESSSDSDPFSLKGKKSPKKLIKKRIISKPLLFSAESGDDELFGSQSNLSKKTSDSKLLRNSKLSLFSDDDELFDILNTSEVHLKKSKDLIDSKSYLKSHSVESQSDENNKPLSIQKVSTFLGFTPDNSVRQPKSVTSFKFEGESECY